MDEHWEKLVVKLVKPIIDANAKFGFKKMTPVQAACIPLFLNYKDVAVEAVTGSGKTLAFIIPIIQILLQKEIPLKKYDIGALIISPTRELAIQIFEVLQVYLNYAKMITSSLFVGGRNVNADLMAFASNGGHIIVGTPGRIGDLLGQKNFEGPSLSAGLKALEVLILDEADRLLDSGFQATLNTILAYLPKQRRTGIFSATQTDDVVNLIRAGMRNPVQIIVKDNKLSEVKTPSTLQNYYIVTEAIQKFGILLVLLQERLQEKTMVFFSTCACVEYFSELLKHLMKNTKIVSLHGKMKQRRFRLFDTFRKLKSGILLCTDVMCRGVDIPQVDWVIQYDSPSSAASFVHRCGRTARNGEDGSAILLLLPSEIEYVTFIKLNQKVNLEVLKPPSEIPSMLDKMREIQLKDRAIMDKANRAFVSHIQAYSKHECSLIINLRKLNLGHLATGFGLIKLPRMPELKKNKSVDFIPSDVDFNSIKYLDKTKEKQRQRNLAVYKDTGFWPSLKLHKPRQTEAWSKKKDKKLKKLGRKEKKTKLAKKNLFSQEELDELDEDFRILKKHKRRKISHDELSKYFGCESDNDDIK